MQVLQRFAHQIHGRRRPSDAVAGVYLWGSVGSGKSMLMDLFAGSCAVPTTRLHFHELMLDVHQQLHAMHSARPRRVVFTKQGLPVYKYDDVEPAEDSRAAPSGTDGTSSTGADAEDSDAEVASRPKTFGPLEHVISTLAARGPVLCLDEMQVTDVADAMVLRQLFEGLFARGVRVVFTSNRPPDELYERGLNRKYFIPAVELLLERCAVLRVGDSGADALDYRTLPPSHIGDDVTALHGSPAALAPRPRGAFLYGVDAGTQLMERWAGAAPAPVAATISVAFGRQLAVRARAGDECLFTFAELCGRTAGGPALGVADYLALASSVSSVYLSHVPVLSRTQRNEARRFVMLIDALYEARVRLIISAEAPLDALVAPLLDDSSGGGGDGIAEGAEVDVSRESAPSFAEAPVGGRFRVDGELATFFTAKDESFMLKRTLSRLTEMTS